MRSKTVEVIAFWLKWVAIINFYVPFRVFSFSLSFTFTFTFTSSGTGTKAGENVLFNLGFKAAHLGTTLSGLQGEETYVREKKRGES